MRDCFLKSYESRSYYVTRVTVLCANTQTDYFILINVINLSFVAAFKHS